MKRRLFLSGIIGAAAAAPALSHSAGLLSQGNTVEDEFMEYRVELIIDGSSVFEYTTRRVRVNIDEYGSTRFDVMDDGGPLFEIEIKSMVSSVKACMKMPERFVNAGFHEWTNLSVTHRMPQYLIPGDVLVVNKT